MAVESFFGNNKDWNWQITIFCTPGSVCPLLELPYTELLSRCRPDVVKFLARKTTSSRFFSTSYFSVLFSTFFAFFRNATFLMRVLRFLHSQSCRVFCSAHGIVSCWLIACLVRLEIRFFVSHVPSCMRVRFLSKQNNDDDLSLDGSSFELFGRTGKHEHCNPKMQLSSQ